MATKADFSEEEWQTLEWAVADTMAYLSMADPGFWDTFKEASGAARFIAENKDSSANLLVRDLAGGLKAKRDKELTGNPTDMSGSVVARVSEAASLVAEKAPEDLPAFREFVLGLAEATAAAVEGIGELEAGALDKIRVALG